MTLTKLMPKQVEPRPMPFFDRPVYRTERRQVAMHIQTIFTTAIIISAVFVNPSSASAERAWSGSILLVDVNLQFSFGGMEYGDWSDFRYLKFAGNPSRGGDINGLVPYRFLPDQGDPLCSTIKGTIRLEVDCKRAELKELVFVRSGPASEWRIDPKIIDSLEKDEKLKRESESKVEKLPIDRMESKNED